jgi:hypothetical protein
MDYMNPHIGNVIVRHAPDTDLAGYTANLKAGYRISSRFFAEKCLQKMKSTTKNK